MKDEEENVGVRGERSSSMSKRLEDEVEVEVEVGIRIRTRRKGREIRKIRLGTGLMCDGHAKVTLRRKTSGNVANLPRTLVQYRICRTGPSAG